MPAASKTKSTFTLRAKVYEPFSSIVKSLGLRRDAYCNGVLRPEVADLRAIEVNSPEAEQWLREVYDRDPAADFYRGDELVRVNLTLDSSLLATMNDVCREKRIPRDIFLEKFLEFATASLHRAADFIADPHANDWLRGGERSFYSELHFTDGDVRHYRDQQTEDVEIIDALSRIRGVTYRDAAEAFSRCTESQRDALRIHPKIAAERRKMLDDSEAEFTVIDLSDLLDEIDVDTNIKE